MNVVELSQRLQALQQQNDRLRHVVSTGRNSQSQKPLMNGQHFRGDMNINSEQYRSSVVDFETKYKKALKEIYQVIQANRSLKEELEKFKTTRSKIDGSMSEMRKEEMYKAYENVLGEKNDLSDKLSHLQNENEHYHMEIDSLQAQLRSLKDQNLHLIQQKQALQSKLSSNSPQSTDPKSQQAQQLRQRMRQKQHEFHRTIQNYQQHHITLSNQNKRNQQRLLQLQQKLMQNDKQWRHRYETKEIESKEIKNNVRHQYQQQINILRKEINSLKVLNTQLMTKLQTIQLQGHKDNTMTEYQLQMLNSIKQLRLQMQPLKKQIIELQQQNYFDKQQLQREKTQLQLKLYQHESTIQHYSITIKNQQQKILQLSESNKKNQANQAQIKKLEEENKILGGRVIVLESKDIALDNRKDNGFRRIEQNVLEFQTRVEMLLNEKENLANLKNVTIHQLVTLKAYIAELDQKLKIAYNENEYATKKYKSYKQKYLTTLKQMKNHELTHNTLKSKILGYDKLVQRLQSELQKNVNIGEMQTIEITTKTTQQQIQLETFKKKYQSLKEKLILQEKYNKQELETIKLNYETKIVDLTIKVEELSSLRQAIMLYKEKNDQLQSVLARKDNEIVELRMSMSKPSSARNETDALAANQSREFILSLQQTIRKQQVHITKIQSQMRIQQDSNRKRILILERQLHESQGEINKTKMSTSSTRYSTDKNSQQLLSQNKKLKNRISQLQNEIILTKGRVTQQSSKTSYELEFKASSLEIQKNELNNRLETELSNRKRLEKQINDLIMKSNQLEAELTQKAILNNRKVQEITYSLNEKLAIIENLQQQLKRIKSLQQQQRKSSAELLPSIMVNSSIIPSAAIREDHTLCENKISRLEREIQGLRLENQQMRRKANEAVVGSVPFNYQLESIKHEKEQYRLKIQRLQRQLVSAKSTINSLQQEKYDSTRAINSLKQEISSLKLSHQDQLFDKDRVLTQLKTKLQHSEVTQNNYLQLQEQLERTVSEKQREISNLKVKLNNAESDMERMNDAINKYNREINTIKYNNEASHTLYTQQMDSLLEQKGKTLKKYQEQIASLHQQIDQLSQELSSKTQALIKTQRELSELQLLQDELSRVTNSLSDRENIISKNRYELSVYEEESERIKRELSSVKEELQRQRLEVLQKDDDLSSLRMQMSTLNTRLSNQIKSEFMDQLDEKSHQLTKITFQLQSLQNSYNNIQQQLNQTQARQRKAQQQLSYAKSQLTHNEQNMKELSQRLMKKQAQVSQITNQMTGLKFLEQEITEKNNALTKLKAQLSNVKVELNHLTEEIQYKESTILRQSNQIKSAREQILNRQETIGMKETEARNLLMQIQRVKSTLEDHEITLQQKDNLVNKLNGQITKLKSQKKQLEDEIEEREQEWSNIQYELNQAKSQITLITDQLQGKDLTITKLANQAAFLRQQITRLNEQVINKSHQINKANQQVFIQKMQYTNKTSEEVQALSNELYSIKRQLQSTKHTVEDLQGENRRLKIQVQSSRVRAISQQQSPLYIYSQQDVAGLREINNNQYREIMQLHLQLNQRNSQIQLLHQKSTKLQQLLHQVQQENHYNKQHLESQIQQFIQHERELRSKIDYLQASSNTTTHTQEITMGGEDQNTEELKFGLKLYTEETDRLKTIIDQLTEEVTQLRLKLTAYTNQQDRINENLVTMVMTFAEIQALRNRMKTKQQEINTVRRSFIQAISSNEDLNSQYKLQSLASMANKNNKQQGVHTFELLQQNNQPQQAKNIFESEVRSDQGSLQVPSPELKEDNFQQSSQKRVVKQSQRFEVEKKHEQQLVQKHVEEKPQVNLPEPIQSKEFGSQHVIQQLNQMKQATPELEQQQHVSFNPNIIQQPQTRSHEAVYVHSQQRHQIITTQHQQRGRTINIVYQGSQVQSSNSIDSQRMSHSQYQSPSGNTYVRITQQQHKTTVIPVSNSGPGVYIPQGMNIQPIRQSGALFTSQTRPVSSSLQTQPQNLRY